MDEVVLRRRPAHGWVRSEGENGVDRAAGGVGREFRPNPAAEHRGRAVRPRGDDALQGRDGGCRRGGARARLLPSRARIGLRRCGRAVQLRGPGRRDHRVVAAPGRGDLGSHWGRRVPSHPHRGGPVRGVGGLLRAAGARAGDPAPPRRGGHPHREHGLQRRRRRRRDRRQRPVGGLRGHGAQERRGLPARRRRHGADAERGGGGLQPRRAPPGDSHGLPRPRRAHGGLPGRPDDRHRRASRDRQVDARPRHLPRRLHRRRRDLGHLLARDEPRGDHQAHALRGVRASSSPR